jgi:hypothetical protein
VWSRPVPRPSQGKAKEAPAAAPVQITKKLTAEEIRNLAQTVDRKWQ